MLNTEDPILMTIVIVTFNSAAEISTCIESVFASDISLKVVVVDNCSTDETWDVLQSLATRFPRLLPKKSTENLGLAAGNNLAMPYLEGDYTTILNPDCRITSDVLRRIREKMEQERDIVILGPKNLYDDGTPHSSYHSDWGYRHVALWRLIPYRITRKAYDKGRRYQEKDVDFVSGACLTVRTKVFLSISGYDPEYFLTVEDVCDLCRRARQFGGRVVYWPNVEITHVGGRSGVQVPYITSKAGALGTLYHFSKYRGRLGASVVFCIILVGLAIQFTFSLLKSSLGRTGAKKNVEILSKVIRELLQLGPFYFTSSKFSLDGPATRTSHALLHRKS